MGACPPCCPAVRDAPQPLLTHACPQVYKKMVWVPGLLKAIVAYVVVLGDGGIAMKVDEHV